MENYQDNSKKDDWAPFSALPDEALNALKAAFDNPRQAKIAGVWEKTGLVDPSFWRVVKGGRFMKAGVRRLICVALDGVEPERPPARLML